MRALVRGIAALLLVLAPLVPALAQNAAGDVQTIELRGTLGTYPIGASIAIQGNTQLLAAHYFYVSHLSDIPLQGVIDGATMTLHEPGGGVFQLHLVGNGSAPAPLHFDTATGLDGTWTQGGRSLPVRLQFDADYPGLHTRWYADVTDQSDAAFESMVRRFIHAVLSNDRAAAARLVSYPLQVNGHAPLRIADRAALLAHWDQIFTAKCLAGLREAVPHEMFVHNGEAMVSGGLVWFDAHGCAAVNVP